MQAIHYTAKKISSTPPTDGNLRKQEWAAAEWSSRFSDMVTGGPALYATQSAVLWNDTHLFIAFRAEEPFLEARQTLRDSIVFLENDLELFIDGGDCYYELEVNAANTVYEVFFVWKDAFLNNPRFDKVSFDVHQPGVYTFGGDYDRSGASFWKGTHPRGIRWAFTGFDMPGLATAVTLEGTLNDHSDTDKGWNLEISVPWSSLALLAGERPVPPLAGDCWNMFMGRFQKLMAGGKEVMPHPAMCLTPHSIYDTHLPEKWSRIQFME